MPSSRIYENHCSNDINNNNSVASLGVGRMDYEKTIKVKKVIKSKEKKFRDDQKGKRQIYSRKQKRKEIIEADN